MTFTASRFAEPHSIDELCELVATSARVRALGTAHSFSDIADTPGVQVSTARIPTEPELDEEHQLLRFSGGARYATVANFLTERGWALHNLGSLPHISVAGAISTGTHGSGSGNGNLSTAVRGLRLVGADGELRWVRHGDSDFPGSVVALGLLGVIAQIELAVEPGYLVRQDVYRGLAWDAFIEDVDAVLDAAYSVGIFTNWVSSALDQVWVKRRVEAPDLPVPDLLRGGQRDTSGRARAPGTSADNATAQGMAGPWSTHLPHFSLDRTPSRGDEIQSEYFVSRADAASALRNVRALGRDLHDALIASEIRTVAADDLWLSGAYSRDTIAIHFTWYNQPRRVLPLCGLVERALAPFQPRPHWGKVHTIEKIELKTHYPRMADFLELREERDPDGKFVGTRSICDLPPALK